MRVCETPKSGMTNKEQTIHGGCDGAIFTDLSQSKLSIAFGNSKYKCDKCGKSWTFIKENYEVKR